MSVNINPLNMTLSLGSMGNKLIDDFYGVDDESTIFPIIFPLSIRRYLL